MKQNYKTKLTSVRLSQAAFQQAEKYNSLSAIVIMGLRVLQDRYPDRIRPHEYHRLHRHGNYYDVITNGSKRYTKIRIPEPLLEWLRYNKINISAACEWAILDSPVY